MLSPEDESHMRRCLALAREGEFGAHPNPQVGCVVVLDGEVVGEGAHRRFGGPHAEVEALAAAEGRARGATLYVTLEPCSHWGKTPPCCDTVIAAGVERVVIGMLDPNPRVAGRGAERLRAAGIAVDGPLLADEAAALNPGFIRRMTQHRPYVRCKLAMSLDGRTAMASGESKWITGEEARADVQKWRARADAVLTGAGTVLADDPALTARHAAPGVRQPLRVIVDSELRTPPGARILREEGEAVIVTAVSDQRLLEARRLAYGPGAPYIRPMRHEGGRVHLTAMLEWLAAERECGDVLLESGAGLAGAMLRHGLVDELLLYIAPVLLGSDARPLFHLPGLRRMEERLRLDILDVAMVGKDCRMRCRIGAGDVQRETA